MIALNSHLQAALAAGRRRDLLADADRRRLLGHLRLERGAERARRVPGPFWTKVLLDRVRMRMRMRRA